MHQGLIKGLGTTEDREREGRCCLFLCSQMKLFQLVFDSYSYRRALAIIGGWL